MVCAALDRFVHPTPRPSGIEAMRLVFIGATEFSRRCLTACLALDDIEVVGIVTAPPHFTISYRASGVQNVRHADLAEQAQLNGTPIITVTQGMREEGLLNAIEILRPDAFVVAGWFHMVPRSWRQLAPAYGLHASLLPAYRGGAPLVWAMINGESQTGISMYLLDDGVDTGPIIGQQAVHIDDDDTIATLYARIDKAGVDLICENLPKLAAGTATLTPQDATPGVPYPQRSPEDGRIDWSQSAESIDRFIRAQTRPYPGAFTIVNGALVRVWRAAISDRTRVDPPVGRVQHHNNQYFVQCGEGVLRLLEVSRDYGPAQTSTEMVTVFQGGGSRFCLARILDRDVTCGGAAEL